ncbi:MAG: amino acid permease [Acidobacteria bacterium]|nr:amino acid permease [Acidobacteriota bacterium]
MSIVTSSQDKPALLRQLGIVSATALVVSNMIGVGIFTTTGFLAGDLGSPSMVLLIWVAGAIAALAGAFCYSELGINFPSSGGEYVYLTRAFGPTWGFVDGWVSFLAGFSAPIAAASLAFASYLAFFFPWADPANSPYLVGSGTLGLRFGGAQLLACGLIATFTLLNFFGVSRVAKIQNVLTTTQLVVVLSFVAFGFWLGTGNWQHFSMPAARTSTTPLYLQFGISLFFIYASYSGWNAATYVAEELRQPARTLPIALTIGTVLVTAIYVGLNMVFIYGAPLEDMKGVVAIGSLAARRLFGPGIAGLYSALMALSLVSTVNAMVTIGPRVYYAMAKNKAFFAVAARVNRRWHTPVVAIVCQGLCAMLLTLTPFANLLQYFGYTLNFFAVMAVSSLFIFRRRPEWQKLRVVSFAWPLMPSLFLLIGLWTAVIGFWLEPKISSAAVLTVVTGALIYHFRIKRRAG